MKGNDYLNHYLKYLDQTLKRDIKTVKAYSDDIEEAIRYLFKSDDFIIEDISKLTYINLMEDWLVPMQDNGLKATSINRKISSFRGFLNFLMGLRVINYNPMDSVKPFKDEEKFQRTILSDDELLKLLKFTQSKFDNNKCYMNIRDNLLVNILAATGMRINEVRQININDINFRTGEFTSIGKRKIKKTLVLNEYVLNIYRDYLNYRNQCEVKPGHEEALFISRNGNRPTIKTLENIVLKVTNEANVTKITPHSFKSKFITSMYESGMDLETIGKITGNKNTQVLYNNYLQQSEPVKVKEIMNCNPIYKSLKKNHSELKCDVI